MNSALVARIFPSRYITADSALTIDLLGDLGGLLPFPGQLDEDVFEARAADFEPQHAPAPRQRADDGKNSAVVFLQCDFDRVLRDGQANGMPCGEVVFDARRQPIERHGHVVHALRQELERVQIASGRLTAAVEDEDVIAQFLRLAEDLCREHDGASAAASPRSFP
jgi:hypothetical protein